MRRKYSGALALALAGGLAATASAQSLTTLFASNNFGDPGGAIYFDIVTGPSPITITALDTNTDAPAGTALSLNVYTTLGSFSGNEANPAAWTLASSGSGTAAGLNQPSPITLASAIVLAPNTTYGVALVMTSPTSHNYTNGTGSNETYSNADLTINCGSATNVPFTAPIFSPRVWNGTMHYNVGGTVGACCLPTGACVQTTSASCAAQNGIYRGDNSPCATANCPQPPTGACCLDTGCAVITQLQCTAQGGTYRGDNTACATANCPAPTAVVETGDAGNTPSTAQVATGPAGAPLLQIRGRIESTTDSDMYRLQICNEAAFRASTVGGTTIDTQLFLFDANGNGVAHDDDDPAGGSLQSVISSQFVNSNGEYFIAISTYDNDPLGSTTGGQIWNDQPFAVERAPDGPAAGETVGAWSGGGGTAGNYAINLQGACFIAGGPACYANCDNSTTPPVLNVNDFICFQSAFAAGCP